MNNQSNIKNKRPKLDQIEIFTKRGGKRAGSGRKKTSAGSVVMRIPAECIDAVTKLVNDYKLQTTNPIYQIEIDGGTYTWSGKGSMPMPFCNFIWRNPKKWEEMEKAGGNLKPVTAIKQRTHD